MTTIVLFEPQIPQNTGNIARLCAANNFDLHLIGHLGFRLSDRYLKRAGMDYWHLIRWQHFPDIDEYFQIIKDKKVYLFSSKVETNYFDASLHKDAFLLFGSETKGISEQYMKLFQQTAYTIPMLNNNARCLNLSSAVAIVAYELIRQNFLK